MTFYQQQQTLNGTTGLQDMTVSFYADYAHDLNATFQELHENPTRFQSYGLHLELKVSDTLVVYETKRRKGVTDSIYYARRPAGDHQISADTAYKNMSAFLHLGQHVALTGDPVVELSGEYPFLAIDFAFRRLGGSQARSTKMILVGLNDDADAERYAATLPASTLISSRPYRSSHVWEWTK